MCILVQQYIKQRPGMILEYNQNQQQQNHPNNEISQHLKTLCDQPSPDAKQISDLVNNIYQLQAIEPSAHNVKTLVQAVLSLININVSMDEQQGSNGNGNGNGRDAVICGVVCEMMDKLRESKYVQGVEQIAELLANTKIRSLLTGILTGHELGTLPELHTKLVKSLLITFTIEQLSPLLSMLEPASLKSQSATKAISLLQLVLNVYFYLPSIKKQLDISKSTVTLGLHREQLRQIINRGCGAFLEIFTTKIGKSEFKKFVQFCVNYQKQCGKADMNGSAFAWRIINLGFSVDNLEKKLAALQCLDLLIQCLVSPQLLPIKTCPNSAKFFNLLLDPRNHQQILSRSINFLIFWFQCQVQSSKQDLQMISKWFIQLIMKGDQRTSNIFSNTWNKFIATTKYNLHGERVYKIVVEILNSMSNKNIKSKSQLTVEEMRLMKILAPLLHKKFTAQSLSNNFDKTQIQTFNFLQWLYQKRSSMSSALRSQIDNSLTQTICTGISFPFNMFLVQKLQQQLKSIFKKYKVKQNDDIVIQIQELVTRIYELISSLLTYISTTNDQQSGRKLRDALLPVVASKQTISNLIISHNSNSPSQVKPFLHMLSLLFENCNDLQFESKQLETITKKVDNSNQYYLEWVRDRLQTVGHHETRQKILSRVFKNVDIYENITIRGYQCLLDIVNIWDAKRNIKFQFCLALTRLVDYRMHQEVISATLRALWTPSELRFKETLTQIGNIMTQMKVIPEIEIQFYSQLLKIELSHEIYSGSELLYSQNVCLRQEITVRIKISSSYDECSQKIIATQDSISFTKLKIIYIEPMLADPMFKDYTVDAIKFQGKELKESDYWKSLRNFGFESSREHDRINQVCVFLSQNKGKSLLKYATDGMLRGLLDTYFQHELTKNVLWLCANKKLKTIVKVFEHSAKMLKVNLEQIPKQSFLSLLKLSIKLLKDQKQNRMYQQKSMNELYEFISSIDSKNILSPSLKSQQGYSHLNLISNTQYFFTKAITLLYQSPPPPPPFHSPSPSQVNNIFNIKKQTSSSNLQLIPIDYSHKIAYQFLALCKANQNMESFVGNHIQEWMHADPKKSQYTILFGLEVLSIMIKDKKMLSSFIGSGKFNEIFGIAEKYVKILIESYKTKNKQIEIYVKCLVASIKIFNQIVRYVLLKQMNYRSFFIATKPQDLLRSQIIKDAVQRVYDEESIMKMISMDIEAQQLHILASQSQIFPQFKISTQRMIDCILNIYESMDNYGNENKLSGLFLAFYQGSRLMCWMIVSASPEQQQKIIKLLTKKLNSECIELALVCKSVLYIYLMQNHTANGDKILGFLFQAFNSNTKNSKYFYQIFGQAFGLCENQQLIQKIIQSFFTILIDSKHEQQNQISQSILSILTLIQKNTNKINKEASETFLQILINNYLFLNTNQQTKVMHPKSRLAVYRSIEACLVSHQDIGVENLYKKIIQNVKIANSVEEDIKQSKMGVGLQNLGNICYMNSLLQMLHCVNPFVRDLSSIKSQSPLLLGLQKLFTNMSNSFKKSISPEQFIFAFEPPIDVGIQEDTTQFLIQFLDKLQNSDNSGAIVNLVKKYLKGETVSKLTCTQCKQTKQKIEDFILYNLSIQNQGKIFNNLDQCLQNAKIPQIIYDVNCSKCSKKTQFTKSTNIKSMANYFIVHLKRLIFDYKNPYTKVKIHSRLEFAQQLVINKQKLSLKAVITHSGTGEHGHYFTTVKEGSDNWIVYNDSKVYPLQQNGKQDTWFGSQQGQNYSTNAYVLLYQKNTKSNASSPSKQPQSKQYLAQVQSTNKALLTKHLLFGSQYIQDFTNFAFNIVKQPKLPDNMIKVYEILALVSYIHGAITKTEPKQYFKGFKSSSDKNKLIDLVFEYKEHNYLFLLHKKKQIRQFFYTFLINVFELCLKQCKLAEVYACELVSKFSTHQKQSQHFIVSGEYLKLIAFLVRQQSQNPQFFNNFYSCSILTQTMAIYIQRKIQILRNFSTTRIQLVSPLLQLLISFMMISKNTGNYGNIIMFEEYQQNLQNLHQTIKNSKDLIQLIFMACKQFQYTEYTIQLLELSNLGQFLLQVREIICDNLRNFRYIDEWNCQNLVYAIWYLWQHYYRSSQPLKRSLIPQILGITVPNPSLNPLSSLKQRTYFYQTSTLNPSLLQTLTQSLLDVHYTKKLNTQNITICTLIIKLLVALMKQESLYVQYVNNLCSPIGLYGDYLTFIACTVQEIQRRTEAGLGVTNRSQFKPEDIHNKLNELRKQLEQMRRIIVQSEQSQSQSQSQMMMSLSINNSNEFVPIFCGKMLKKPFLICQDMLDVLYVIVQQSSHYWTTFKTNNKSRLTEYVDEDGRLKSAYSKSLDKLLQSSIENVIEQQPIFPSQSIAQPSPQIHNEQLPQVSLTAIRRKLRFSNPIGNQIIEHNNNNVNNNKYLVQIVCENMKNQGYIFLQLEFNKNNSNQVQVWVEKYHVGKPWGAMAVKCGGCVLRVPDLEPSENIMEQGMHNDSNINHFANNNNMSNNMSNNNNNMNNNNNRSSMMDYGGQNSMMN